MVDVAVPSPELVTSEQPVAKIDAAVFNRPLQTDALAQGAQQLGQGAEALAEPLARQQAQSDGRNMAVTYAADGQPQVATPANSIILGRAGQDYQDAAAAGMRAALSSHISQTLTDMHLAHETDGPGFLKASQDYVTGLRNNTSLDPRVANALADQAQGEAAGRYANIAEKNFEIGTRDDLQSIQTNIADTENKMRVLARQGGMNTDVYKQLDANLEQNYGDLSSHRLFGYSKDRTDSELATARSTMQAESVVGQVDSVFQCRGGDGGRAGAQRFLDDQVMNNPDLHLSDPERRQIYAYGMAHLEYLTTEQTAQIKASRLTTDKIYNDLLDNKIQLAPSAINQAIAQAQSVGDAGSVAQLSYLAAHRPVFQAINGFSDEARMRAVAGGAPSQPGGVDSSGGSEAQAMQFFQSKGWSSVQAAGIVGNLLRESGLRAGAVNRGDGSDGSDSIGIGQWNGTRAVALRQFAAQQGRSAGDFGTQLAFVQHELETSESNAAGKLREATDAPSAAAAFADAARGILQGQALMQAEPKLAPNKDDFPAELAKVLPFNDLPQTSARNGIDGAVQAAYAKLSADANDTTGVLNSDRVAKAVDMVTGGVASYRGSKLIGPWYGAGQSGLDGAVRSLTDADFTGARTTNGEAFPASALKPSFLGSFTSNNWRLQSAGDGKYLVFSGPDDARQYLGDAKGGKFILDLGSKRGTVERSGLNLVTEPYREMLLNSAQMGGGN